MTKLWASGSRLALQLSGLLALALLWETLPRLGAVSSRYLPPLSVVLSEVYQLFRFNDLFANAMVSLWRVSIGVLLAALIAVPVGIVLGHWLEPLSDSLNRLFRILGQVNPFSLMPVFLLFFGIGETAKLAVVIWIGLWPALHHTIQGVRAVDPLLVKAARGMGISEAGLFFRVLLPAAVPSIFLGIRSSIHLSFFILIAGEMLGGSAGLGWMLHVYGNYFVAGKIYAVGLCIALLGVVLVSGVRLIEDGLFFWKEPVSVWEAAPERRLSIHAMRNRAAFTAALAIILLWIGAAQTAEINRKARDPLGTSPASSGTATHEHKHEQKSDHKHEEHSPNPK